MSGGKRETTHMSRHLVFAVSNREVNGTGKVTLLAVLGSLLLALLVFATAANAATNAVKFHAGTQVPVDVHTPDVEAGDINGDGHLDVAVGASAGTIGSQHFRILAGDGNGGFIEIGDFAPPDTNISGVAMGDMNSDSKPDLVYAGNGNTVRQVRIALGNGDGTFTESARAPVGTNPGTVTLADVNSDGSLDAIVGSAWPPGSSGSATGTVTVVRGDGAGGFGSSASYTVTNTPGGISVGDVDGDGDKDVAVARFGSDVALLLNNGTGSFTVTSISTGNSSTADVVLADLDGDTDLDVASGNPGSGGIGIALNSGSGNFSTTTGISGLSQIYTLRAADFDNDGDQDLAAVSAFSGGTGTVYVYGNNGSGAFSLLTSVTPNPRNSLFGDLDIGDVDEDGWLDMLALRGNPNGGLIPLLSNLPPEVKSVSVSPSPANTDDTVTTSVSTSDPNGDTVQLGYQWQLKPSGGSFSDIPGETGSSLDLSVSGHGDPGDEVRVAVTATDGKDSAATVYSDPASVTGGEPEVSLGAGSYSGLEGDAIAVSGTARDPDNDPLTLTWSATPGSGVDAGASCVFANAHAANTTVKCTDDGPWTLTLEANDGGQTVSASAPLTIQNANPSIGALGLRGATGTACQTGNTVNLAFTVTDPGTNDPIDGTVQWGDGSSSSYSNGAFSGDHTYAAGRYTITVHASDDDSGEDTRSSATNAVSFLYDTHGFLQPVNMTGTRSAFKIGSTVPLKVEVTDCAGAPVSTLHPDVDLKKVDSTVETSVNEVVSSSSADTSDAMRWDPTTDPPRYMYNLSTKRSQFCLETSPMCSGPALTQGTYQVKVSDQSFAPVIALIELRTN